MKITNWFQTHFLKSKQKCVSKKYIFVEKLGSFNEFNNLRKQRDKCVSISKKNQKLFQQTY